MTQANINTNAFTATSGHVVSSTWIARIEFGTLELSGVTLNAVLVEMLNGVEYVYLGVTNEARQELEAAIDLHITYGHEEVSIGQVFNRVLRPFQCYARLHQAI